MQATDVLVRAEKEIGKKIRGTCACGMCVDCGLMRSEKSGREGNIERKT